MSQWPPQVYALAVGLLIASITDLRTGKIPNQLNGALMVLGMGFAVLQGSALASVIGLAVAFAIHFPLWVLKVEKAGDAKLLMAIGALMGWELVVETTFWCAVLYLPLGLIQLVVQKRMSNLVATLLWLTARARGLDPGPRPPPTMLRTAPIIAGATGMALLTDWLDFVG